MTKYTKYKIFTHAKVKKFIDSLDRTNKARIDRFYELFEEYGTSLPSRYLKKITLDIWELRPGNIRLFLIIKRNKAFVLHGIQKKTQKTPKKDLDLTTKRSKDIQDE